MRISMVTVVIGAMSLLLTDPAYAQVARNESAAEVLRLLTFINETREEIERDREAELRSVARTYQQELLEIDPKDMFESESEYQLRRAKERSDAEIERAKAINEVHRTYDAHLRADVEPHVQRVQELLNRADIIPRRALEFHLETYDAESQFFHGVLKVDSPIIALDALIHFPMKRADARTFWENRTSLTPSIRVELDRFSLATYLRRVSLEDGGSAITTKVFVVPRPPISRPPVGKTVAVSAFKVSANELTERAAKEKFGWADDERRARSIMAAYNRLIREMKGVFVDDAFVQSIQEIVYHNDPRQTAVTIAGAAAGLDAYLTSFAASDGFAAAFRELTEQAGDARFGGAGDERRARSIVAVYNRLIQEMKSVFANDVFTQSLQEIGYQGHASQAARSVATAAGALAAYLTSFVPSEAFKVASRELAERAGDAGFGWADDQRKARSIMAAYNRLIREMKGVFPDDAFVQSIQAIVYHNDPRQTAATVAGAAAGLDAYLTSFAASDGFAAAFRELTEQAGDARFGGAGDERRARSIMAVYNRLIQEMKSVFVDDATVKPLQDLEYQGSPSQVAKDVANSARRLERIVSNIRDVPIALELSIKNDAAVSSQLVYLPYSGRYSAEVKTLANELKRQFSLASIDESGWTDLHTAAYRDLPGLASALLDGGADPNARTSWGYTPIAAAANSNALTVAADLVWRGAAVNPRTHNDQTPLHFSAFNDSRAVAEFLVGQGADLNAYADYYPDKNMTPLDFAVRRKASEVAVLLRRHGASCNKEC